MRFLLGAALLLTSLIVSQVGTALAYGLIADLGPAMSAWLRLTLGAMMACLFLRRRYLPYLFNRHVCCLATAVAGMALCFTNALHYIPIPTATALQFLGPFFLAVAAAKNKIDYGISLLAITGMALIGLQVNGAQGAWPGICWAGLSGAFWVLYIVSARKTALGLPGFRCLALAMVMASLLMSPFIITAFSMPSGRQLLAALAAAVFLPLLPYFLEMSALRLINTWTFSIVVSLEPCAAIIISRLMLRQHTPAIQLVGVMLIVMAGMAAIFAGQYRARRQGGNA
ncbi:EamA family transporter [Sodalis sp. RH21]|uniref:EamA family transporter n=1 Tax=unclassified Sodalis (in: enterobacteria) TaxID=2636512 RepID=UPI0039B58650